MARSKPRGTGPIWGIFMRRPVPTEARILVEGVVAFDRAEIAEKMTCWKESLAVRGNWYSSEPRAIITPPTGTPKACGLTVRY